MSTLIWRRASPIGTGWPGAALALLLITVVVGLNPVTDVQAAAACDQSLHRYDDPMPAGVSMTVQAITPAIGSVQTPASGIRHVYDPSGFLVATKGIDGFVDLGSGGQLIRQADIDGLTIRVKSRHGYRPGHGSTDITSVLARDQVDSALAADLATRVQVGAGIKRASEGFSTFQTVVGDHLVEYRAVFVPATGAYEIPTYYIP